MCMYGYGDRTLTALQNQSDNWIQHQSCRQTFLYAKSMTIRFWL